MKLALLLLITVNLSSTLHLIGTRTSATACPVGPHIALTARHVIEPEEPPFTLRSYRFSTDDFVAGVAQGREIFNEVDLGIMTTEETLRPYSFAAEAPEPGDMLYLLGYDWRKEKSAWASRYWVSEVIRTQAGHILFTDPAEPGTSGSCVMNASGEVVGIYLGAKQMHDLKLVGLAAAVYGKWKPAIPR